MGNTTVAASTAFIKSSCWMLASVALADGLAFYLGRAWPLTQGEQRFGDQHADIIRDYDNGDEDDCQKYPGCQLDEADARQLAKDALLGFDIENDEAGHVLGDWEVDRSPSGVAPQR
jgi:hypothetical protein